MKKLFLLIIGCTLWLSTQTAYGADCSNTLYDNEFNCIEKSTYDYCSIRAKLLRSKQKYNLYESIYCDTADDNSDDVYEAVATQFKTEDPKWNADLVEFTLLELNQKSIETFLQDTYGKKDATDKLPATVKRAFFDNPTEDKSAIYTRVKNAYDREKIIYQSQESLKQQFENSEIWANGSLTDSPFDLIVDLNLIEKVLFGSRANWVSENDVWNWPEDDDDDSSSSNSALSSSSGSPSGTSTGDKAKSSSDKYVCVPDKTITEDKKGAGTIPKNCGNGTIEHPEECDDCNNKSGDGDRKSVV